jgi:hypothetical protein
MGTYNQRVQTSESNSILLLPFFLREPHSSHFFVCGAGLAAQVECRMYIHPCYASHVFRENEETKICMSIFSLLSEKMKRLKYHYCQCLVYRLSVKIKVTYYRFDTYKQLNIIYTYFFMETCIPDGTARHRCQQQDR